MHSISIKDVGRFLAVSLGEAARSRGVRDGAAIVWARASSVPSTRKECRRLRGNQVHDLGGSLERKMERADDAIMDAVDGSDEELPNLKGDCR